MRLLGCTGEIASDYDVIVVGSGAAGLTAALRTALAGAEVLVLEKTHHVGGTSALSGGMLWLPGNGLPGAPDPDADRVAARRYLQRLTWGRQRAGLLAAHLRHVPSLLDFLATEAGLLFDVVGRFPDYRSDFDGASRGGRSVEPRLWSTRRLGEHESFLRPDPRPPFRQNEYFEDWRTYANIPWRQLEIRRCDGIAARGRALVGPIMKAAIDAGVTFAVDAGVQRLRRGDGVHGVLVEDRVIGARRAIVLATGGFEWNDDLCERFLSGPVRARCSVPSNTGDGHLMAMDMGTGLAGMNEAWWGVMATMPGLSVDGRDVGSIVTVERSLPGTIVVNRSGRRFMNESGSYYDAGKVMGAFDPFAYSWANLPAYLIGDARFVRRHGILGHRDPDDVPEWMVAAPDIPSLADRLGMPAAALCSTVDRFNLFAANGRDVDFHRGETHYDRYFGDPDEPHPNLGPLVAAPFVAMEVTCGAIGTKGGVTTDPAGQALDPFGEPIEGLFALGNTSAHPVAFGYAGAGTTLGPAMTMAHAAGGVLAEG